MIELKCDRLLAGLLTLFVLVCAAILPVAGTIAQDKKPNVVLISIDDLNDWIGCLGGHPQARTPNIDALAKRGVLFTNAHCQSPVCNPSRASMMSSLYPETTGIYFLNPDLAKAPAAQQNVLLPRRFEQAGYHFAAAGKLMHGGQNQKYLPNYGGSFGGMGPLPKKKLTNFPGHPLWDWGPYPAKDEQTPDYKIASWGIEQLQKEHDKPLFLGTGFYRPHVPHFAPQKWIDLFPIDEVQLPVTAKDDLDDLSEYAINLTRLKHVAPTHKWVVENNEWKPLVQTYLACVTFVDHQVGRVLDALDDSVYKDNTYVVLYSDHGFELGEKERWAKRSLWENSTSVPMIIMGPGIEGGRVCHKPVELIDIYPTLLDLTGQDADPKHEGQSLVPLLKDVKADWPHPARTSFGPGNVAIKSEHHRYIRYADGSEEFYDHQTDPHELQNVIADKDYTARIDEHRKHLPNDYHAILGTGSTGHKAFAASEAASKTP
ncbi:MAG: sulfatase [Phycisphaeraceae bacterium]|nr:sulfatase [Phycisphaeraceae bacterium]